MRGLIPVALAAFAVLVAGFLYMALHDDSGPLVESDDTSLTEMVVWSVAAGVAALAFGIVCLRSGLFMTLAYIIAVCFSVLLVGFSVLFQLKAPGELNSLAPRAIEAWQPLLFLLIAGSLAWCLQKARHSSSRRGRGSLGFGVAVFVSAGLMVFALWVWVFGLGTQTPATAERTEAPVAAPQTEEPSGEAVRKIIAQALMVPEERVIPSARFDEDLNAHEVDVEEIVDTFEKRFGVAREVNDDEMLITVQDAIDYAASPDTFRIDHRGHIRYWYFGDPYPSDLAYSKGHQWIRTKGNQATIGIPYRHEQPAAYVEKVHLPEVGATLIAGKVYASVDMGQMFPVSSVLIAPVSGTVIEVNPGVASSGNGINKDPYAVWIVKVELTNPKELDSLLSAAEYEKFVAAGN